MIDLETDAHYLAVWYAGAPGKQDFMAIVYRSKDAASYTLRYRFRYYRDQRVFNSDDVKNNYVASMDDKTEEQIITIMDEMLQGVVASGFCDTNHKRKIAERHGRLIIRGDGKAFVAAISKLPFVHIRNATPEEVAAEEKTRADDRSRMS